MAKTETTTKVEAKEEIKAEVIEYPTQTARAIKVGEQVYDVLDALALLLNEVRQIKKAVA